MGGDIGERISDAIERSGLSKSEVGRRIGTKYRVVHTWTTGTKVPGGDYLHKLAQVLGVSIDELLGVAHGQDPPFAAWSEFLATTEGGSMTEGERRTLQSMAWPPGRAPTVAAYQIALAAVRATQPRAAEAR